MPVKTSIRLRRGTASSWTSTNPVLSDGEPGVESDTGAIKIGDGTTAWASLGYALSSRYKPLASDRVWISAPEMIAVSGSPTLTNLGGYYVPSWRLDPDATERVAWSMFLPKGWKTAQMDVWMTNANAGVSGNVRLTLAYYALASGDAYDSGSSDVSATVSIGANTNTTVWSVGTLTASLYGADDMYRFYLERDATNGADTLAADVAAYGVLLTRLT